MTTKEFFNTESTSPEEIEEWRKTAQETEFHGNPLKEGSYKNKLAIKGIAHEDRYIAEKLAAAGRVGFEVYRFCFKPCRKTPSVVGGKSLSIAAGTLLLP